MSAVGARQFGDELLAVLVASIPEPVFAIDPEGNVAYANGAVETLLGKSSKRLLGKPVGEVVHFTEQRLNRALQNRQGTLTAQNMDLVIGIDRHADVDVALGPIDGFPDWAILLLTVQPPSRALIAARDRQGEQASFGAPAILSHEIKNPLAGIKGAAQLLLKRADDKSQPLIELIVNEVDRIARIIDQIQHLGTRKPPNLQSCNIHVLLDRAIQSIRVANDEVPDIRISFDPSLPDVIVDPDATLQILINLLQNATDALEDIDDPKIFITTRYVMSGALKAPGEVGTIGPIKLPVEISISDNGSGVPEHIAEELFSPFVSSKRDGQGLGLAIVQKLMRDMNSRVVHDRDESAGLTHFRLLFPISDWRRK